jgi:hypothetical protein
MDDPNEHKVDEPKDKEVDPKDKDPNDPVVTPADTDPEGEDDPKKKANAEEVAKKQEKKWLDEIQSGKKTLDDMPENLGWLKKRVEKKLDPKPKKEEEAKSDTKSEVRQVLAEERAQEEFDFLIDDLREADISAEKEAQLKEEYESYLEEFPNPTVVQQVKALKFARKAVGLKDTSSSTSDRKRKGMQLPPLGGKKRKTMTPDKETEMQKKFGQDLPPGFDAKAKKK